MRAFRHYCSVMEQLSFPEYTFRFSEVDRKKMIFDVVRKKYVRLTPEEWVRQHVLHFLIHEKEVPVSLIAVETAISYEGMSRRCDIVIYKNSLPCMLIECKAPEVPLSSKTVEQIARYQSVLNVPYLWLSNGIHHLMLHLKDAKIQLLEALPSYSQW